MNALAMPSLPTVWARLLLLLCLLFGGCAAIAPSPAPATRSEPAPARPADQRAAMPAALSVERQWLQSWFDGTPVSIRQRDAAGLSIDVPREFCFAPGKHSVKPALAAVLDKVAESLRRLPFAHVQLVAAPSDSHAGSALALRRAEQVRRHLRSRGVAAERLAGASATAAAAVQLSIEVVEP